MKIAKQYNAVCQVLQLTIKYIHRQIKLRMKIQDSLDRQQQNYNLSSSQYYNTNAKQAMQNLYKQQLDQIMFEKGKQKQYERSKQMAEKKQFNQRAISNKESERIKEQAYKNYYNMLLNNQQQLQNSYVSPFSIRDTLKDQHITHSIEEGEVRMKQWEIQQRRRQAEKKNMYRSELMNQIQERKRVETMNKQEQQRKKDQFRKYGKLPDQISKYERQRQLDEMNKYKEDLDRFKNDRDSISRGRTMSQQQNVRLPQEHHHALINPLPFNIQNPYILKEMTKQNYLAGRGNQNIGMNNQ